MAKTPRHPDKVFARIEGGLGNQLFQYAAARSLADRLNCDLALDLRGLEQTGNRPFELNLYNIRANIATEHELLTLPTHHPTRIKRFQSELSLHWPNLYQFPVFWPQSFAFDARFEWIKLPLYLVGYWQTEKYFAWNRSQLLNDLKLVNPIDNENAWLKRIQSMRSVALHIRRGDYVTHSAAAQFHGLCDMAYYQQSVEQLHQSCNDIEVFVFSDDPEWTKVNLRLNVPTHFIELNAGHFDLELMRNCQHHIVANSSFSWWGAWLSKSTNQQVFSPKRWFADPKTDTSDVAPTSWHQI